MMRKDKIQKEKMRTNVSGKIIKKFWEINKNKTIKIKQNY